jgi:1-acyl-sn-glycerol-3-phosphate acyltransferase
MIDKARYRPSAPRWFNKVLRCALGTFLRLRFRIRPVGTEVFKHLKPPYVVVPTHHGVLDPFMVGSIVPEPVYWVTGDGSMRSSVMRMLLGLVGSIPKSKAIPDLETIGWIVEVIRKRGGVVGLFAEGQASWDGHTQAIIPSTAKLLKLLKVPVVVAVLKGSFSSQPRWAWNHRPNYMEIEFKLVMNGAELKAGTPEQILAVLEAAMDYDEEEWKASHPVRCGVSGRARHLELSLFMCPACGQAGTMRSYVNRLYCRGCGHVVRLSKDMAFTRVGSSRPRFVSIREWDLWQQSAFADLLRRARATPALPVFSDSGVLLLKGRRMNPLLKYRTGSLILYPDRVELATLLGERLQFPIAEIEGQTVIKQQLFEFYHGRTLYQFRFPRRFQSARKWAVAIEVLKATGLPPATS